MSLNDRDWYRRALSDKQAEQIDRQRAARKWSARPAEFVQLPLPYMGRKRRAWRWLVRALRSEWFNTVLAVAVAAAALWWFS